MINNRLIFEGHAAYRYANTASAAINIFQKGFFYFEFLASSGERMLTSEAYSSREQCQQDISLFINLSRSAISFCKRKTSSGKFFFTMQDPEGGLLATSETFWSQSTRDYSMLVVKREAAGSHIDSRHAGG